MKGTFETVEKEFTALVSAIGDEREGDYEKNALKFFPSFISIFISIKELLL